MADQDRYRDERDSDDGRRYGAGDYEQARGGGRYYREPEDRAYAAPPDRRPQERSLGRPERPGERPYGAGDYEMTRGRYSPERPRGAGEQARFKEIDRIREPGRSSGQEPAATGYGAYAWEGARGEGRDWMDKVGDEMASWFGDRNAERRREWDHVRAESHRGRGPKDYKRSDDRILEDINDRLTEDNWLDASHITVSVKGGEATLDGAVAFRADKRRAEDIADSVSGVGHVQNNLRVRPDLNTADPAAARSEAGSSSERPY